MSNARRESIWFTTGHFVLHRTGQLLLQATLPHSQEFKRDRFVAVVLARTTSNLVKTAPKVPEMSSHVNNKRRLHYEKGREHMTSVTVEFYCWGIMRIYFHVWFDIRYDMMESCYPPPPFPFPGMMPIDTSCLDQLRIDSVLANPIWAIRDATSVLYKVCKAHSSTYFRLLSLHAQHTPPPTRRHKISLQKRASPICTVSPNIRSLGLYLHSISTLYILRNFICSYERNVC